MSDVKCIKLISGEDIIAEIDESVQGLIVLKDPLLVMMVPNGTGKEFGIGLAPFCPHAKDRIVPVMAGAVIAVYEPETGMKNEYNTKFGKGIVLPKKQIFTN
jgi:hypothetical protein